MRNISAYIAYCVLHTLPTSSSTSRATVVVESRRWWPRRWCRMQYEAKIKSFLRIIFCSRHLKSECMLEAYRKKAMFDFRSCYNHGSKWQFFQKVLTINVRTVCTRSVCPAYRTVASTRLSFAPLSFATLQNSNTVARSPSLRFRVMYVLWY